eukprot:3680354-Prymnesium_polylepis.1
MWRWRLRTREWAHTAPEARLDRDASAVPLGRRRAAEAKLALAADDNALLRAGCRTGMQTPTQWMQQGVCIGQPHRVPILAAYRRARAERRGRARGAATTAPRGGACPWPSPTSRPCACRRARTRAAAARPARKRTR